MSNSAVDILRENNIKFQEKSVILANEIYESFAKMTDKLFSDIFNGVLGIKELSQYMKKSNSTITMTDKITIKNIVYQYFKKAGFEETIKQGISKLNEKIERHKIEIYDLYIKQRLEIYRKVYTRGFKFTWETTQEEMKELRELADGMGLTALMKLNYLLEDLFKRTMPIFLIGIERSIGIMEAKQYTEQLMNGMIIKAKKDFYKYISALYLRVGNLADKHLLILGDVN